jgi:signal recognition particle receptor subunit beta
MVQINFAQRQVNAKIVYYGPGMSGKTTNLEIVHQRAPSPNRGDLTSISTDGDRTLFFDFMPLDLGTVAGMRTCFQIYTVPGQVYYNSTRKLVLQGTDGVVFVADSSASMVEENLESMRNLEQNLAEYGKTLAQMPLIIQYNKRDLPDAMTVEELNKILNPYNAPFFEAIANTGQGVFPTLKALAARVLESIHTGAKSASGPTVMTGQTGFYPQPAQVQAANQAAQQRLHQTGFHQAPAAQAAPGSVPTRPLLQTGFTPAPNMQGQAGGQRAMQPGSPGSMQGHGPAADPLARTAVHAPPSIPLPPMPLQPGMVPVVGTAGSPPAVMQPQHFGGQPGGQAGVAMVQQQQQQPAAGNPLHMLRVDKSHAAGQANAQSHQPASAAKTRPLPGAARPQASKPAATAPRIQPRAAPLPTPAPGGGNKRMMYVLLFVGVAFGLAAVVAKIVLKLF